MKKIHIALLFGGRSAEHAVSILSAKSIFSALDPEKYDVTLIEISQEWKWMTRKPDVFDETTESTPWESVSFPPESGWELCFTGEHARCEKIDVVFPILHGPYGEDGTVQWLLELANVPYVGAWVLGSAVGMDKDVMKRLLRDAHIPVAKFLVFQRGESIDTHRIEKELGFPCFVKPANLGSSVWVSRVAEKHELEQAIQEAYRFDRKILIEQGIVGREIECSVLGNNNPLASLPWEVIAGDVFYSYDEKYSSEQKTRIEIPAKLDAWIQKEVQELAVKTFRVLECEWFGRIDFFLENSGRILVNEINTIPWFTAYSMYPKLWEASGVGYSELIDTIIRLAIERYEAKSKLQTSHEFFQELDR